MKFLVKKKQFRPPIFPDPRPQLPLFPPLYSRFPPPLPPILHPLPPIPHPLSPNPRPPVHPLCTPVNQDSHCALILEQN